MKNDRKYGAIIKRAHEAGMVAGNATKPTPMIVGTPTTPFGNDIDRNQPVYVVEQGPCGFAYIHIKGNTSFGRWASKSDKSGFRKSDYYGGLIRSCFDFGQSFTRKEDYARAFVGVLKAEGIDAYMSSRLD